jgi:hypothetical protein
MYMSMLVGTEYSPTSTTGLWMGMEPAFRLKPRLAFAVINTSSGCGVGMPPDSIKVGISVVLSTDCTLQPSCSAVAKAPAKSV